MVRVAIFHPTDPAGHVPGGIDTIIRGILRWAPPDLDYTLFGATSDERARPIGKELLLDPTRPNARFIPLTTIDPTSRRAVVPVYVRYLLGLFRQVLRGRIGDFDVLDCHRIESLWLFSRNPRAKNITVHQDMSIIRDPDCDIMWRYAPSVYEWIESQALHSASNIFTVRHTAVTRYKQTYPDLAGRIAFFPTWFESSVFHPAPEQLRAQRRSELRRSLGIPESARVVVTVGRLDKQKDPLKLIEAVRVCLSKHPDLHVAFIGDGVLRSDVERAGESPDLQGRLKLLGALPPARIAAILQGADLFVLSSAYEGMPIAVLEALATGLPVVSTPVGEVPLVVHDGVSGQISAENNAAALAEAIDKALSRLAAMAGPPCVDAVAPYRAEAILQTIYANHRALGLSARR